MLYKGSLSCNMDEVTEHYNKFENGLESLDEYRDYMMNQMERFIVAESFKFKKGYRINIDDIQQAARLAVLENLERYDPLKGTPITYFSKVVRNAFAAESNDISLYYHNLYKLIEETSKDMGIDINAKSIKLVASAVGIPEKRLKNAVKVKRGKNNTVSLDDENQSLLMRCSEYTEEKGYIDVDIKETLKKISESLTEEDQEIFEAYIYSGEIDTNCHNFQVVLRRARAAYNGNSNTKELTEIPTVAML